MKYTVIPAVLSVSLAACSSVGGPDNHKLLPDSGPTTQELIRGNVNEDGAYYGDGQRADYIGVPLMSGYAPNSSYSLAHVQELQRDFQQVPNPQITAYVYPHLNEGQMPVPGYFTVFNLYDTDHYALATEGYYGQN